MRADFYQQAVEYAPLADLLRRGSFPLAIPKRDALRQMIERPAERADITFEGELVNRILERLLIKKTTAPANNIILYMNPLVSETSFFLNAQRHNSGKAVATSETPSTPMSAYL